MHHSLSGSVRDQSLAMRAPGEAGAGTEGAIIWGISRKQRMVQIEGVNRGWLTRGRRILITGGAGFIGSHLAERLVAGEERVDVLDNLSRGHADWLPAGVDLYEADLREPESVRRVVEQARPEVVVHLAALHFIPAVEGAPELARQVNVEGTRNLLCALASAPPDLLLFASTAAVYPDRAGPISESCPPEPPDLYGRTKVEGEELLARFGNQTEARCIIARLFNVIGKRETNPHVVPELVGQLRQGRRRVRLGNIGTRRDYTDVADVAEALTLLLRPTASESRVFNIGSGRGVSVAELVEMCANIVGREIRVDVDPRRLRAHDRRELVADIGLLQRATGWAQSRLLEETLEDLLLEPQPEGAEP
jgi:UDP-glucose 4-epimerase